VKKLIRYYVSPEFCKSIGKICSKCFHVGCLSRQWESPPDQEWIKFNLLTLFEKKPPKDDEK